MDIPDATQVLDTEPELSDYNPIRPRALRGVKLAGDEHIFRRFSVLLW